MAFMQKIQKKDLDLLPQMSLFCKKSQSFNLSRISTFGKKKKSVQFFGNDVKIETFNNLNWVDDLNSRKSRKIEELSLIERWMRSDPIFIGHFYHSQHTQDSISSPVRYNLTPTSISNQTDTPPLPLLYSFSFQSSYLIHFLGKNTMPFFNNFSNLKAIFAEQTRTESEKNKFIKNAQNIKEEKVEQTPMKISNFQAMLTEDEHVNLFSTKDKTPEEIFGVEKMHE